MSISNNEASQLNRIDPTTQKVGLGTEMKEMQDYGAVVIKKDVDADASSGLVVDIPFDIEILDVVVQCTGANANGTLQLKNGANAITDAIVCAVDTTMVRAGTIDDDYSSVGPDDTIKVFSNGAGDRGILTIIGKRA